MKIEIDTHNGIAELQWQVEEAIQTMVGESISAEKIGLDGRAGQVYVFQDEELIGVEKGHYQRLLEYYGGYIESLGEDVKLDIVRI